MRGEVNYTSGETAEAWSSAQVSEPAFRLWGVQLLLGRAFRPEEEAPGAPRVAILGEGRWKKSFAGDPRILGQTILLDGEPHTVIGVAADSSGLLMLSYTPEDVFVPYHLDPNTTDVGNFSNFYALARLKRGITPEQAHERLEASAAEYRARFPKSLGPKDGFTAQPIRKALFADLEGLVAVLAGAVALVLLIACANIANLLLARATRRQREMGIRVAVGASRGRVIRQLLTESVMLGLAGGALGLLAGSTGIQALIATVETDALPSLAMVSMDWRVAGFALATSLFTGILFGLFPAVQASRVDLNTALKESGGNWTGFRRNKARAALVISEVSLAVVLLVGSALLIRTFVELYRVDRGFSTNNVAVLHSIITGKKYTQTTASAATMVRNSLAELRNTPGVVAAAATCCPPLVGNLGFSFEIAGRQRTDGEPTGHAGWVPISGDYFDVLQIPVKRGRVFTERDTAGSTPVVIISERMATEFWKDRDPLGDRIVIGRGAGPDYEDSGPRQIVGIVGDVRQEALSAAPNPRIYVPQAQLPDAVHARIFKLTGLAWMVRTQSQQLQLVTAVKNGLIRASGLPVDDVKTMDQVMSVSTQGERFSMLLMSVFGGSALLLAAVGIYGLMAYTVGQRTHEIGVRLVLGAEIRQIRSMVIRQGMALVVIGMILGIGSAWALVRTMESLLFGVKARDPMVFVVVPLLLGATALLAVWIPARRALRVDPAVALRHE